MGCVNDEPWEVYVFRSYEHWEKPIKELSCSFPTEKAARDYARIFSAYNPNFKVELIDTRLATN